MGVKVVYSIPGEESTRNTFESSTAAIVGLPAGSTAVKVSCLSRQTMWVLESLLLEQFLTVSLSLSITAATRRL